MSCEWAALPSEELMCVKCGRRKPAPAKHLRGEAAGGPGSELKRMLAAYPGISSGHCCKCNARASLMDENGCDWCLANTDEIVGWLREEHARRKLPIPFSGLLAGKLVRLAVRNARKKGICS